MTEYDDNSVLAHALRPHKESVPVISEQRELGISIYHSHTCDGCDMVN